MGIEEELREDIDRAEIFRQQLDGPVWSYIKERAALEIDDAVETLKRVDPGDRNEVARLQTIIARNEGLGHWLIDILERGDQAREFLESQNIMEEQGQ